MLILVNENLCKNCFYFTLKCFLLNFFLGNVLLGGELQIDVKNSNLEIFESALYMKSGNMPLNILKKLDQCDMSSALNVCIERVVTV